ncbi:hypothetical protein EWM09_11510 [Clostridioides difficile]|nr:hypothetical protein [Clostridioides difficile]TQW80662.1 hypothetical protein D1N67_00600 [Clostridioides difficile]TQY84240.1 hypothetical protein EWM14_07135 [Clostridioides difficile]TQY92617.1 hypothetical protein EWM12_03990 [Clostridioides difficile]TQY95310.1 hypothetical protein EWM11_11340 [Clostridioides difficile]
MYLILLVKWGYLKIEISLFFSAEMMNIYFTLYKKECLIQCKVHFETLSPFIMIYFYLGVSNLDVSNMIEEKSFCI